MKTLIKEMTHLTRSSLIDFGWGNGYVVIPKGHKLHGMHYDDIDVEVHGGLTYGDELTEERLEKMFPDLSKEDIGGWIVGFDTAHYDDSLTRWPKEEVQKETERLKIQLESL